VKSPHKVRPPFLVPLGTALVLLASCGRGGAGDTQTATEAIMQQIAKYTAALDAADSEIHR
jgi:hypothetical protein